MIRRGVVRIDDSQLADLDRSLGPSRPRLRFDREYRDVVERGMSIAASCARSLSALNVRNGLYAECRRIEANLGRALARKRRID